MAESQISVRIHHLCCQICSEVLTNPATIPCGHNFCMQCIQECWGRNKRNNTPCSCPECGHIFPSTPQMIKNTTLAELVRDTQRLQHSRESGNVPKRHRSCEESGASENTLCWRHNSPLDLYCCTDEQKDLKNMQRSSKKILQKHKEKKKILGVIFEQMQEEAKHTQDFCEGVVVSVISSLQRHYQSVRELIGAQEVAAAAQVHSSIQSLEAKIEETKKRDAELDRLMQTDSDVHFLQEWPSLQHLCQREHLHPQCEVSEDPLLLFKLTKKAVEQLGKQLEDICDKEFPSISENVSCEVTNTVTKQSTEPTTRAEFLRYACDLTLDLTTAHEDLLVSEGGKEVKLRPPQTARVPSPRHPQRFISRRQVLCREGLQAERCYYEIEVEGSKVEIALTYKGINRRSLSTLSAFGGNKYSWSLDRSEHYSVSHKGNSVQLLASPSHHRIGIYLKFKEGTLSFYEVSDSMTFLYKVEDTFTEPLYPGFWLGENCCIRIGDLQQDGLKITD